MKYVVLFALLISTVLLPAQPAAITAQHIPETAALAQPFTVQYQLALPPGSEPQLADPAVPADFTVSNPHFNPQTNVYELTVQPFTLGKSTFTVSFVLGKDTPAITTEPAYIDVKPVETFKDKKLREIRPPFMPRTWLWLLLFSLAALLIGLLCWYLNRRKYAAHTLAAPQDNRPCEEIANAQLDMLLNSGLWENKKYKLFYITLTDILRQYLYKRLAFDASAETSAELLRHAKQTAPLRPFLEPLRDFLSSGDLVKFARVEPTEQTRNKDVLILRELIAQTTPKPTPTQEKA